MLALAETPGTNPSTSVEYWGQSTRARRLARRDSPQFSQDHLGSLRALFDGDEAWAGTAEYEPYGMPRTGAGPAELPGQLFTGKSLDLETMLYYFPFRYYSPVSARWMTRDPLGMVDGPNVYGYGGGSPLRRIDRYGHFAVPWWFLWPPYMATLAACGLWGFLKGTYGPQGAQTQHCVVGCKIKKCAGYLVDPWMVETLNDIWEWWESDNTPEEAQKDSEAARFGAENCAKDCASCEECCSAFYPAF